MSSTCDVAVIGLGAWGSAAAYHLARRGKHVIGLDRYHPPHRMGSSHGQGRVIRLASPESPLYTPLQQRAYELWDALAKQSGRELIREVGGLYVGTRGSEIIEGSLASYEGTTLKHELLDAVEIRRRFPEFTVGDDEFGVWEDGAGVIQPEWALEAHLEGAARAGAELRFGAPVSGWTASGNGFEVSTPSGPISAGALVLALGSWAEDLIGVPLPVQPERQVVVRMRPAGRTLPIFVFPAEEPYEVFYGCPEGDVMKVGFHHGGALGHPDHLSRVVTGEEVDAVNGFLRERIPSLAGTPVETLTCLYTNSPDRHYIIDRHPEHPEVVFATGCSGRGYKMASMIGEALADLVDGKDRPDLAFLSAARFPGET